MNASPLNGFTYWTSKDWMSNDQTSNDQTSKDSTTNDWMSNDWTSNWTQRRIGTQQRMTARRMTICWMTECQIGHKIERLNIEFERWMTEWRKIPLLHIMISLLNYWSLVILKWSHFRSSVVRKLGRSKFSRSNDQTSNDPTWYD
jgi:hypothetical protein